MNMLATPSASKPLPRYRQIKQQLAELLREGKWRHGQALPSEPLLAQRFGASIGTVRKAIDELVAENIVVREQGRGTFVKSHTRDYMLNVFFQLVDDAGRKELPRHQLLSFVRWRADVKTAERLGVAPGSAVLRLRNLLALDGKPTVYDDIRLPAARFAGLTANELSERDTTLYGLMQQRFGITVVRIVEHLEAVAAPADVAALLAVTAGHPLLRIVRTGYSYGGEAADTRLRYVRTGARRYESVLGQR
ncbi:MAG: GntR family transcriptional regulator [Methylibium sp.]|nr:GntR family transcriptional regulator [Methylibium sp.]